MNGSENLCCFQNWLLASGLQPAHKLTPSGTYMPFHNPLPKSSVHIQWISVGYYEMGVTKCRSIECYWSNIYATVHFTKPYRARSRLQIHWISVRFYEMDDIHAVCTTIFKKMSIVEWKADSVDAFAISSDKKNQTDCHMTIVGRIRAYFCTFRTFHISILNNSQKYTPTVDQR